MSLLEGLGSGKPVIAPNGVGMVPEFPASDCLLRYPAGDLEALVEVVTACYARKCQGARLVESRTWDAWAEAHDHLFVHLLRERGLPLPQASPGFRFGMLRELEIPLGTNVERLERALDSAGRHIFYGRLSRARAVLEEVVAGFPCAARLLDTLRGATEVAADSSCPEMRMA
jgi:hypothetical protein